MKCTRLKNWHVCWNRLNKLPMLDLDGDYTGNRYPLCSILSDQLFKRGASYWRHENTPLPENRKYNTQ